MLPQLIDRYAVGNLCRKIRTAGLAITWSIARFFKIDAFRGITDRRNLDQDSYLLALRQIG